MAVELKVGQKIKREHTLENGFSIGTVTRVTKTFAEVDFVYWNIKISLKRSYEDWLKPVASERFSMVSYSLIKEIESV
jgi:hypothetical protein